MTREIQKSDLVPICERGLESLKFCGHWEKSLLSSIGMLTGYMEKNGLEVYSESVGEAFIAQQSGESPFKQRTHNRAVYLLESFVEGRKYVMIPPRKTYVFPGDIGACAQCFIGEEVVSKRLSRRTVRTYTATLSHFSVEMEIRQVTLDRLRRQDVETFMSSVQNMNTHVVIPLRKFLGHLYGAGITARDFSVFLQHFKHVQGRRLPCVYDPDEVLRIEASIHRGSAVGKRDYAMLLLASRLGLRASDIVNMEFSNVDWENKAIRLFQLKTGRPVELPLLGDVGDAIIDYVLHGRPETGPKKIFVTASNPVRPLAAASLSHIFRKMFSEAGIEAGGRRYGGHAFRHSLATRLLGNNVGMPVISSVLGHGNAESAKVYLGVDVKQLLECSLAVPVVDKDFYEQEGGLFYE